MPESPLRRTLAALALLLLASIGCERDRPDAHAGDRAPTALPEPVPAGFGPGEHWFGMYFQGTKVGFAHDTLVREADALVSTTTVSVSAEAMGKKVELELEEQKRFAVDPPFRFIGGRFRFRQGTIGQDIELRPGPEGKLHATITSAGQVREMVIDAPDYTLEDERANQRWIAAEGRKVGDRRSAPGFQMMLLKPCTLTLEITAVEETVAHGVPVTQYVGLLNDSLQGNLGTVRMTGAGEILTMTIGGLFEMRAEPKDVAQKVGKGGDLFLQNLIRLNRPLGSRRQVTRLVLEITGEGAEHIPPGPNQSVEKREDGIVLRIGVDAPVKATEEEIAENLEETVLFPVRHEAIIKLARGAIGDAATPRAKVDALVRFVAKYVKDELRPQPLTVLEVVEDPRGDCAEHALLFTTLARAVGVPARMASGLGYTGDQLQALGGHAWAEVVLDGHWVPVDPTWNETEADATHIRTGTGLEGMTTFAWVLGRVKVKVLDVDTTDD